MSCLIVLLFYPCSNQCGHLRTPCHTTGRDEAHVVKFSETEEEIDEIMELNVMCFIQTDQSQ